MPQKDRGMNAPRRMSREIPFHGAEKSAGRNGWSMQQADRMAVFNLIFCCIELTFVNNAIQFSHK
jgi:hypothetical protein